MVERGGGYWRGAAKRYRELEKKDPIYPPPVARVVVNWSGDLYIGHIQEIVPEYSREVVLLSKTSDPVEAGFAKAMKEVDPERLEIEINDPCAVKRGRLHIFRRLGTSLTSLTEEQQSYVLRKGIDIVDM